MLKLISIAAVVLMAASAAPGQSAAPLSFDVASVKPAAPCCAAGQWRESKAGEDRIDFRYVTLRYCVAFAWRLKEYQVSGPAWIGETRFDIVAKGPEGTRHDQLPDMMQQLLADRFKLLAHHEKKEFSVIVLIVGKNGPKLKESPPDSDTGEGAAIGLSMTPAGVGRIEVKHGNMTSLANTLSRVVGRPVVDMTGLTARYDFDLEFVHEDAGGTLLPASPGGPPPATAEFGSSVFSSIQRIGLKLEAQKPALDAIVVDRAEKAFIEN
jgi:uncharacterized protein (TIGR03435 family)